MKIIESKPSVNPGMTVHTIQVETPNDVFPGDLVYYTRNLTRFQPSVFNRPVRERKKLEKSLRKDGYDLTKPIITRKGEQMLANEEVEGHHRTAIMTAITNEMIANGENVSLENSPFLISFMFDKSDKPLSERIIEYNTDAVAWNGDDFLSSYCAQGIESYLQLREIMGMFKKTIGKGEKAKEKPQFAIGAVLRIATHNLYTTASDSYKKGTLPKVDANFAVWVLSFINAFNVKSATKTETINALTNWFSFIYPHLSNEEKLKFNENIRNYDTRGEVTEHIKNFFRFADVRLNNKAIKNGKEELIKEMVKNSAIPTIDIATLQYTLPQQTEEVNDVTVVSI